jgi:hypothetical protein
MADDLAEILERLDFCYEEAKQHSGQVVAFIRAKTEIRKIPHLQGTACQVRMTEPPPKGFSIKIGMIVHEARSCLDALACALADRHSQKHNRTYFPISKSKEIFEDDGYEKIRLLSEADKQTIIDLKPYKGANDFLFGMHEFDRTRKHIRLLPALAGGNSLTIEAGESFDIVMADPSGEITKDWKTFAIFGPGSALRARLIGALLFDDPEELKGRDALLSAKEFIEECQRIVGLFA